MFFILLLLWIAFNGKFTLEILIFGVVISAALYAFMYKFMGYSPRTERMALKKAGKGFLYVINLVKEIIKANIVVIGYIYNAKIEVEPRMVFFKKNFKNKAHNSVLANSITLTPGTITVLMENGDYTVHCLDRELGTDLDESSFVKRLDSIEGGH